MPKMTLGKAYGWALCRPRGYSGNVRGLVSECVTCFYCFLIFFLSNYWDRPEVVILNADLNILGPRGLECHLDLTH